MVSNVDFLVVQQHTVDGLDSGLGRLSGVIVNETITLGASALVCCDLARKDVTKGGKSVVKSLGYEVRPTKSQETDQPVYYLIVNLLVKVLDEDVALAGLAEGWVSLRPHDAAGCQDVGPRVGDDYRWRSHTRLCP